MKTLTLEDGTDVVIGKPANTLIVDEHLYAVACKLRDGGMRDAQAAVEALVLATDCEYIPCENAVNLAWKTQDAPEPEIKVEIHATINTSPEEINVRSAVDLIDYSIRQGVLRGLHMVYNGDATYTRVAAAIGDKLQEAREGEPVSPDEQEQVSDRVNERLNAPQPTRDESESFVALLEMLTQPGAASGLGRRRNRPPFGIPYGGNPVLEMAEALGIVPEMPRPGSGTPGLLGALMGGLMIDPRGPVAALDTLVNAIPEEGRGRPNCPSCKPGGYRDQYRSGTGPFAGVAR